VVTFGTNAVNLVIV